MPAPILSALTAPAAEFPAAPLPYRLMAQNSYWISARSFQNSVSMMLMDTLALCLALSGGGAVRYWLMGETALPAWTWMLIPAWWLGSAATELLPGWGLSAVEHLKRLVFLLAALFCIGMVGIFFARVEGTVSRLSICATFALALFLVPLVRTTTRHLLCVRRQYGVPTIVFGRAAGAELVIKRLAEDPGVGYFPSGVCTDDAWSPEHQIPLRGSLHSIPHAPAAVVVAQGLEPDEIERLTEVALASYRNVMVLPNVGDLPSLLARPRDLGGLVGLEMSQRLYNPIATKIKRALDLTLVLGTAPLWVPVFGLITALVWLEDRQPPIYRQERRGRFGKSFSAFKCRTMVVNAEVVLKSHLAADPQLNEEWKKHFKLRKDPRITRMGAFLRRSSLDELPQLLNVLLGHMALVGPRPLPVYHLDTIDPRIQRIRERMRPGLTGLWQVSGRSDIGTEGMIRWDGYYVKNWSIWLDIVIIVRTLRAVVSGFGAR